jgi:hypothetical protein
VRPSAKLPGLRPSATLKQAVTDMVHHLCASSQTPQCDAGERRGLRRLWCVGRLDAFAEQTIPERFPSLGIRWIPPLSGVRPLGRRLGRWAPSSALHTRYGGGSTRPFDKNGWNCVIIRFWFSPLPMSNVSLSSLVKSVMTICVVAAMAGDVLFPRPTLLMIHVPSPASPKTLRALKYPLTASGIQSSDDGVLVKIEYRASQ